MQYPSTLIIQNDGPDIISSNFWETEIAEKGFLYASINSGAIRLLVPQRHIGLLPEMRRNAQHAIVSFCNKPTGEQFSLEILIEDKSSDPFVIHLHEHQYDRRPLPEDIGKKYTLTVWTHNSYEPNTQPHKRITLPAYLQIVPHLPWLQPIEK